MTADPWSQPRPAWEGRVRPRVVGPADVRSVMFATTRMKVGYEVAEVDAFLDQVELSMEQMLGEIQALRRRIASTDQANEARMYDIRVALEQLLIHLGGPTGQPSGVIDPNGHDVPLYTPAAPAPPAPAPAPPYAAGQPSAAAPPQAGWHAPPSGPVSDSPPPAGAPGFAPPQSAPGYGPPPQAAPAFVQQPPNPQGSAPTGVPTSGFPPPPPNTPPAQF